nr:hypothetical protein [Tanacetum cinerariifolium]
MTSSQESDARKLPTSPEMNLLKMNAEDEPIKDDPIEDEPIEDEPVEDDPIEDEPIKDEPVEDKPVGDSSEESLETNINGLLYENDEETHSHMNESRGTKGKESVLQ